MIINHWFRGTLFSDTLIYHTWIRHGIFTIWIWGEPSSQDRETPQPAPRCGGGTARSSAEPDESTQGSAHGNLGDLMTRQKVEDVGNVSWKTSEEGNFVFPKWPFFYGKNDGILSHGILAKPYFQTNPACRRPMAKQSPVGRDLQFAHNATQKPPASACMRELVNLSVLYINVYRIQKD